MSAVDLAVDAVAVHRLTRLVTSDVITRPWRARIIAYSYGRPYVGDDPSTDAAVRADDYAPKLAVLITCPWCVSVYVAAGAVLARRYAPGVWRPVARVLAFSTAAALIANREEPPS